MRTAIVHYWLLNMRGGERVVEALCHLLPDANIFTLFYDPDKVSNIIRQRVVHSSYLQPFRRHYRKLLALMPMALESFDLSEYDLVISSESGPAKGVITRAHAQHICYCHTPMRYLWELHAEYRNSLTRSWVERALFDPLTHYLRMWDYASAARVDEFIANSENVQRRIRRTYRRDSAVIHPPVAVESFYLNAPENYYLIVAELVAYKRLDTAVRVFARSGQRLLIAGNGPEFKRLKSLATPNIEFCGRVSDAELRRLYARCIALVMPGEEDFGITAVEALASGKPVISLRRGGACETVPEESPFGGVLYRNPADSGLSAAVLQLEAQYNEVQPLALQRWARRFSTAEFDRKICAVLPQEALSLESTASVLTIPSKCASILPERRAGG